MLGDFGPDGLQFRQLVAFDPRLEGGKRVKVENSRYGMMRFLQSTSA